MADVRLEVTCPGCEKPFFVPPSEQGHVGECPHCRGWVDIPEFGRDPSTAELDEAAAHRNANEYERQQREAARQLDVGARQLDQAQRGLDARDRLDARVEQQTDRVDQQADRLDRLMATWESLAERMSKLIARIEGGRV